MSSSRASVSAPPTEVRPSSDGAGAKTSPPASAPSHQLLELDAVALAERPALALAVIGEHDQVVGARRLLDGALQPRELGVVLLQHGERIGLLDPGVVGDLVVADEGRVDDRDPLDDVARAGSRR